MSYFHGVSAKAHNFQNFNNTNWNHIKEMGCNSVMCETYWSWIETREGTQGAYDVSRLASLRRAVDNAKAAGLIPMIIFRPTDNRPVSWKGWACNKNWDYVNTNKAGRARYNSFLRDMARDYFNDIPIGITHFPFHAYGTPGPTDSDIKTFYHDTLPLFHRTVRSETQQTIIVNPRAQGQGRGWREDSQACGEFANFDIYGFPQNLQDTNILIGFNNHGKEYNARFCCKLPYGGVVIYSEVLFQYQPMIDWMQANLEYKTICVESTPVAGPRPPNSSQISWLGVQLDIMSNYKCSRMYYEYGGGWASPLTSGQVNSIGEKWAEYPVSTLPIPPEPEPEPPPEPKPGYSVFGYIALGGVVAWLFKKKDKK